MRISGYHRVFLVATSDSAPCTPENSNGSEREDVLDNARSTIVLAGSSGITNLSRVPVFTTIYCSTLYRRLLRVLEYNVLASYACSVKVIVPVPFRASNASPHLLLGKFWSLAVITVHVVYSEYVCISILTPLVCVHIPQLFFKMALPSSACRCRPNYQLIVIGV